jgi:hypothetical protein
MMACVRGLITLGSGLVTSSVTLVEIGMDGLLV